jgi:hypothetical protein
MCGTPIRDGPGPVGGRAHERMPKAHVCADVQQAGLRGGAGGSGIQTECLSRPEHECRVADRVGGREQDQPPGVLRQPGQPPGIVVFDPFGQASRIRQGEPAGQFGGAETPAELEQRERIAPGFLDDPGPDAFVERT